MCVQGFVCSFVGLVVSCFFLRAVLLYVLLSAVASTKAATVALVAIVC